MLFKYFVIVLSAYLKPSVSQTGGGLVDYSKKTIITITENGNAVISPISGLLVTGDNPFWESAPYLYINNYLVGTIGGSHYNNLGGSYPVQKGDIIKLTNGDNKYTYKLNIFPFK